MNRFSTDICIRWIIASAKVAVLFGLLLFLLSCCSCSSARKAEQVSLSQSDTISMVSAKVDSVGLKSSESSYFNHLVEISGLEIIFPEPGICSARDTTDVVSPASRASPKSIRIDAVKVATSSGSEKSEAKDSISVESKDESYAYASNSSEVKIRSPATTKWQAAVVLVFVLLVIAFTAYQLYSDNRPRDQTSEN